MLHRMLHRVFPAILLLAFFLLLSAVPAQSAEHRFGIGAQFWKTIDDIEDDGFGEIEDDGFAYVVSYKYVPRGMFSLGLDLEGYDSGFGGADDFTLSPIAWLYVGKRLYAGAGVGVSFSDGFEDDISDPFWAGRVGFEFHLLPRTTVDINANYRAGSFDELDQADTDSITLGAMVRWSF